MLVHQLQEREQDLPQRLVPGSLGQPAALADDHREQRAHACVAHFWPRVRAQALQPSRLGH